MQIKIVKKKKKKQQQQQQLTKQNKTHLISKYLLKQRLIKNQERFIAARRFGVIVTPSSRD